MEKSNDAENIKEGVILVFNKLRLSLQQKGLKKMESLHQDFDADLHEAITEIPAGDEKMQGKVMDDIEPGYYLNDKIIRHAKVVVENYSYLPISKDINILSHHVKQSLV